LSSSYKYEDWYIVWSSNKFERQLSSYKYEHRKYANVWHLDLNQFEFCDCKKKAIVEAKIMNKSRDDFDSNSSLKFNDTIIERQENNIYLS
jgi:hypothetical protein